MQAGERSRALVEGAGRALAGGWQPLAATQRVCVVATWPYSFSLLSYIVKSHYSPAISGEIPPSCYRSAVRECCHTSRPATPKGESSGTLHVMPSNKGSDTVRRMALFPPLIRTQLCDIAGARGRWLGVGNLGRQPGPNSTSNESVLWQVMRLFS